MVGYIDRKIDIRKIYNRTRSSAKRRGIEFSISLVEFDNLTWPITCPILGIELSFNVGKMEDNSYSIDRIDSSRGYEVNNIEIISMKANRIKNNGSKDDLMRISKYLDGTTSIYSI